MITVQEIMGYEPCGGYPQKRVAELWDGKESLSPKEIAELEIPYSDRVWALCYCLAHRDLESLVRFAQNCAARAATETAAYAAEAATQWALAGATEAEARVARWAARAADAAAWAAVREVEEPRQLFELVAALEVCQ